MFCRRFFNVAPLIRQLVDGSQRGYCVVEKIHMAKNLVNFGLGTMPWQPFFSRETMTSWHSLPLLFVLVFENG